MPFFILGVFMKKLFVLCFVLFFALSLLAVENSVRRGALVLTFDDFGGENWVKADAVFKKYDAHATFLVSGEITPEKAAVMKKLQDAGHSVGLHTVKHRNAAPLPGDIANYDEYFVKQVKPQLDACKKYNLRVRTFAYPNNRRSEESDKMLFAHFDYLRAGWSNAKQPIYTPLAVLPDKMVLGGGGIGEYYKTDLNELKKLLDKAAETDSMIVFFSHNIYPKAPRVHMPTEWLVEILQYARKLNMNIVGTDQLKNLKRK